jgi:hypothetical protein
MLAECLPKVKLGRTGMLAITSHHDPLILFSQADVNSCKVLFYCIFPKDNRIDADTSTGGKIRYG